MRARLIVRSVNRSQRTDRNQAPEIDRADDLILDAPDSRTNVQLRPGKENLLRVDRIEFAIVTNRTNGVWLAVKLSPIS